MPRSTCHERAQLIAMYGLPNSLWSVQIDVYERPPYFVSLPAFLDAMKALHDMGSYNIAMTNVGPCVIKFETRISDAELGRIMQNYPWNT